MILTKKAIQEALIDGGIIIDPYRPENLNPVSVDLTLGHYVVTYATSLVTAATGEYVLDSKVEQPIDKQYIPPEVGYVVRPGRLYLMHTEERVRTDSYVPVIDGKSSIGRLGIQVHMTAGYGEPGFDGQWTLEVTAVHPVRVYAGMRICQMRFHTVCGEIELYSGNYRGANAHGPVASKTYKQFKDNQ